MKIRWLGRAAGVVAIGAVEQNQQSHQQLVRRGEYLTRHVAMCVECHSPRDEAGQLIAGQLFRGAPIPFPSPFPHQEWAVRAPNIAGLTGFTDDQIMHLLMEGQATGRVPPKPPMPPFRLSREDAEAVVAYLRSL